MSDFCDANSLLDKCPTTNFVTVNQSASDLQINYDPIICAFLFLGYLLSFLCLRSLRNYYLEYKAGAEKAPTVNAYLKKVTVSAEKAVTDNAYLKNVTLEVGFNKFLGRWNNDGAKTFESILSEINEHYDTDMMARDFHRRFKNRVFTQGKKYIMFMNDFLDLKVTGLEVVGLAPPTASGRAPTCGVLLEQTSITFTKPPDVFIQLTGSYVMKPSINVEDMGVGSLAKSGSAATPIMKMDFKLEEMGIGGLDIEFNAIYRRAFASCVLPAAVAKRMGIRHVKGIVLHGPRGTGKTLVARQIGKMLNARDPAIVNGSEFLNKSIGLTEMKIRELFIGAEKEFKAKGDDSGLHVIVFDELDVICKEHGSSDGKGTSDSVVNQLLAKLDGVNQLNNIFVIGTTNRLNRVDEALLLPGRLELQMEISLPDEKGRLQILKIHTAKMRKNSILGPDVNLEQLASLTKNFSGAEIARLVKSATFYAFKRHVKANPFARVSSTDVENMKVYQVDFLNGLNEEHPSFDVSETELKRFSSGSLERSQQSASVSEPKLKQCAQNQVIPFGEHIERILLHGQLYVDKVRNSEGTPLCRLLLHGPPGSGKTTLATTIAMSSKFPSVELISPRRMAGMSESDKVTAIHKNFEQAYKSSHSVILMDDLERILDKDDQENLIDWVDVGPWFSNTVLQALLVSLKQLPPRGCRLLIIATTSQPTILDLLELTDAFDAKIHIPAIDSLEAVDIVMKHQKTFDDCERKEAMQLLGQADFKVEVGIKKLLMMLALARQEKEGKVERFVHALSQL